MLVALLMLRRRKHFKVFSSAIRLDIVLVMDLKARNGVQYESMKKN